MSRPRTPSLLLAIAVAVLSATATAASGYADRLQEAEAAYLDGRYGDAADAFTAAIEAGAPPDHTHYNLACARALNGEGRLAVLALGKALGAGFSDIDLLTSDPDLESIRGEPSYLKMVARLRKALEWRAQTVEPRTIVLTPDGHAAGDSALPLLVALHGYGEDADHAAELWKAAAQDSGRILVATRAPVPLPGGGYTWNDAASTLAKVETALVEASAAGGDPEAVTLVGISEGAEMALALAWTEPARFSQVVAVGAGLSTVQSPQAEGLAASRIALVNGTTEAPLITRKVAATRETLTGNGATVIELSVDGSVTSDSEQRALQLLEAVRQLQVAAGESATTEEPCH